MNFDSTSGTDDIISDINVTPLVDVMLVLLIVFMITMPVMQQSVKLDLPQANSQTHDLRPPHVRLSLRRDGSMRWNDHPILFSSLSKVIAEAAARNPQPELHLYADRQIAYGQVAKVLSAAQSGGLTRIGFVTDTAPNP